MEQQHQSPTVRLTPASRTARLAGTTLNAITVRRFGAAPNVEIVLVIDTSGSMTGDKLGDAAQAVRAFAQEVASLPSVRVGEVTFHGSASVRTVLQPAPQFAVCVRPIEQSEIGNGGTNMGAGLDEAGSLLVPNGGAFQIVILMSDGCNTSGDPFRVADALKQRGVTIVCVAFGGPGEVDHDTLKRLASSGSHFHVAYNGSALRDLFRNAGRTVSQSIRAGVNPRSGLTTL